MASFLTSGRDSHAAHAVPAPLVRSTMPSLHEYRRTDYSLPNAKVIMDFTLAWSPGA